VEDDKMINFSFVDAGFGVWGEIRALVSFNYEVALGEDFDRNEVVNEATVELVYIPKQTETQGLGSRIATPEYTDQFIGLLVEEIWPQSKGGKIRTFTGATLSTKATIEIIRAAAEDKLAVLPSAEVIEAAVLAKREAEE
jgi:Na+-transporting NADH:ubiquinone oxidoreductase subunit NqrC